MKRLWDISPPVHAGSPVFPGEPLTVRMWRTDDGSARFTTQGGDDRVVIDNGRVTFDPA